MFILIFIICFALILFTGLYLMKSNIDFIEHENKRYLKAINKLNQRLRSKKILSPYKLRGGKF